MAGDPTGAITWHGSGDSSGSPPNLGGVFSNTQIRRRTVAISAVAAVGATVLELDTVDDDLVLDSWLYLRDGASGGRVLQILDSTNGTPGTIRILDPLTAAIGIGDAVQQYDRNRLAMPFHGDLGGGNTRGADSTSLESAQGFVHYSCHYILNLHTAALTQAKVYLEPVNAGRTLTEIAQATLPTGFYDPPLIADESDFPDLTGSLGGGGAAAFTAATQANPQGPFSFANGTAVAFWLKRTSPVDSPKLTQQAVAVVLDDTGGTGIISKAIVNWDTLGFTPDLTLRRGPSIYLGGGARLEAEVRALETGLRVVGQPVTLVQTVGPGTLTVLDDPPNTDERGIVDATYQAPDPTQTGQIGATVTFEASI